MITVLKKGISDEKSREASKQVEKIVEGILQGITDQGDAHVRELSEKFDNWSPTSFRLSDEEIQACIIVCRRTLYETLNLPRNR